MGIPEINVTTNQSEEEFLVVSNWIAFPQTQDRIKDEDRHFKQEKKRERRRRRDQGLRQGARGRDGGGGINIS